MVKPKVFKLNKTKFNGYDFLGYKIVLTDDYRFTQSSIKEMSNSTQSALSYIENGIDSGVRLIGTFFSEKYTEKDVKEANKALKLDVGKNKIEKIL